MRFLGFRDFPKRHHSFPIFLDFSGLKSKFTRLLRGFSRVPLLTSIYDFLEIFFYFIISLPKRVVLSLKFILDINIRITDISYYGHLSFKNVSQKLFLLPQKYVYEIV